jgi:transcriptional regulator
MNGFKITTQGDIVDKIYKHRDNYNKKGKYLKINLIFYIYKKKDNFIIKIKYLSK